jgi:hypothetical protein
MNVESSEPTQVDKDQLTRAVEIWKYIVSVQMHFNDMEMKVRNLYFTILAASMGLVGVVQGKEINIEYPVLSISLPIFVLIAVIPVSMLFYFIDRHWYHRLLQGSVKQCIEIENKYKNELPEIQLGSQIRKASPVEFKRCLWRILFFFVREERFRKTGNLHSDAKIEVLYKSVIWGAVLMVVVYAFMGGVQFHQCSPLSFMFELPCAPLKASAN